MQHRIHCGTCDSSHNISKHTTAPSEKFFMFLKLQAIEIVTNSTCWISASCLFTNNIITWFVDLSIILYLNGFNAKVCVGYTACSVTWERLVQYHEHSLIFSIWILSPPEQNWTDYSIKKIHFLIKTILKSLFESGYYYWQK